MWISGLDDVMSETRTFPRFVPRTGKKITVVFGQEVDTERVFGDLRRRWRDLKCRRQSSPPSSSSQTSTSSSYAFSEKDSDSDSSTAALRAKDIKVEETPKKGTDERRILEDRSQDEDEALGILPDSFKYHPEAIQLRIECTLRIRNEVLKLRKLAGEEYPDEDPKAELAETWREEKGGRKKGQEGRMGDGSIVKDG